jgi:hypothetical protein
VRILTPLNEKECFKVKKLLFVAVLASVAAVFASASALAGDTVPI